MATPIAELFVSVGADVSGAILGLQSLAGELTGINGAFAAAVPAAEAMVVAGAGIAAGLGAAAVAAADFQEKLVQVRNNTTLTDQGMADMQQTILKLGAEAPVDLNNLATGFMHVSNFGFDAAQSTQILEAAMRSAVSTGGNTAATAEVLAAVLHEFGLSGADASKTMDELHTASAEGNLTLEQFSQSFGQVAAFAAAVGVPLDQAAAAMAAMTRHGFDAATAATQVKDQIVHLINPSQQAKKTIDALSQASGIDLSQAFTATGLHTLGLTGVLDLATRAMNKAGLTADQQTSTWLKLIPNIRGGAASFVLAGRGAEDFSTILNDMHQQLGVTDEAFDRIKQTTGFQFGVLANQVKELAITLGSILLPSINGVVKQFSNLILLFTQLPENVQQGIVKVAAIASGLLLFGGEMILLAPLFGALISGVGAVIAAFASLSPIILLGLGVFAILRQAWDRDIGGIREVVDRFSNIGDIIQQALSGDTQGAFESFIEDFKSISPEIRSFIDDIQSRFSGLQSFLTPILSNIGLVLDKAFSGNFAGAFDTLQAIITAISPQVGGLIQNFRDFATALGPVLGDAIRNLLVFLAPVQLAFSNIVNVITTELLPYLGQLASDGFQLLLQSAQNVQAFWDQVLGPAVGSLGGLIQDALPHLDDLKTGLLNVVVPDVKTFFDSIGGALTSLSTSAQSSDAFGKFFESLGSQLSSFATQVQSLGPLFEALVNFFTALGRLGAALDAIGTALTANVFGQLGDQLKGLSDAVGPAQPALEGIGNTMQTLGQQLQGVTDFFNNAATAINNLAAALENFSKAPTLTLPGGVTINNPAFLPPTPGTNGAAAGALTGPGAQAAPIIINNNGVTITSGADLNDFSQSIANAIRNAATRVSPPVSNSGNPAIEGQFT